MSSTRIRRVTLAAVAVAAGAAPVIGAATASAATMTEAKGALNNAPVSQSGLSGGLLGAIPVAGTVAPGGPSGLTNATGLTDALAPGSTRAQPTTHPLIPTNTISTSGESQPVSDVLGGLGRSVSLPTNGLADAAPIGGQLSRTLGTGVPSLQNFAGNTVTQLTPAAPPATQQRSALPTSSLPTGPLLDPVTGLVPGGDGLGAATQSVPSLGGVTQSLPTRGLTGSLPTSSLTGALGSTPLGSATDSLGQF